MFKMNVRTFCCTFYILPYFIRNHQTKFEIINITNNYIILVSYTYCTRDTRQYEDTYFQEQSYSIIQNFCQYVCKDRISNFSVAIIYRIIVIQKRLWMSILLSEMLVMSSNWLQHYNSCSQWLKFLFSLWYTPYIALLLAEVSHKTNPSLIG